MPYGTVSFIFGKQVIFIPWKGNEIDFQDDDPNLYFRCYLQSDNLLMKLLTVLKHFNDEEIRKIIGHAHESTCENRYDCDVGSIMSQTEELLSSKNDTLIGWSIDIMHNITTLDVMHTFDDMQDKSYKIGLIMKILFVDGIKGFDKICENHRLKEKNLQWTQRIINFFDEADALDSRFIRVLKDPLRLKRYMANYNRYCFELAEFLENIQFPIDDE